MPDRDLILRDALESVHAQKQDPTRWSIVGICDSVEDWLWSETNNPGGDCGARLREVMQTWPGYSGHPTYPVPGDYMSEDFEHVTCDAEARRMWDWTTSDYAELRWQLLEHCIKELGGSYADRA